MTVSAPAVTLKQMSVVVDQHELLTPMDLHIPAGRWFGIVGPNGGGKSTLLKAIAGLYPHRGDILLHWSQSKPGTLGYMPQGLTLDASLPITVSDYLRIHCERRPVWRKPATHTDVQATVEQLEIQALQQHKVGNLSMGQQQRLMLCAALANRPQVLLLDEPLAGIDKEGRALMLRVLGEYHQAGGSILMVEHNWSVIKKCCEEIAWIDRGLKRVDTPENVLAHLGAEVSPFDLHKQA